MKKLIIAPSILSSDFANLASECKQIINAGADALHVDIMDGHFVPNLTIGPPVVKAIRKHFANTFLDCHLMVSDPAQWIEPLAEAGASNFTFHLESTSDPISLISQIKKNGMRVGIAIKPETSVSNAIPFLELVDMVLVMSVEPGFGGQKFMPLCIPKIEAIRKINHNVDIEVDGGITVENVSSVISAGANVIVAGSSIFNAPDPRAVIAQMKGIELDHHHSQSY